MLNQAAGKTSLLESIVGLNCLPRNVGITTRRPLLLKLQTVDEHPKAFVKAERYGAPGIFAVFEEPWPGECQLLFM